VVDVVVDVVDFLYQKIIFKEFIDLTQKNGFLIV